MTTTPLDSAPACVFQGVHFMTPIPVQYRTGQLHGQRVYIEVSTERPPYFSPDTGPLFGVTFASAAGQYLDPDPSRVFFSLGEANEYIDTL